MAGHIYIGNSQIKKIYIGNSQIKKIYIGNDMVYNCGNIVTYYVDTNLSYQEEVESEATCLSPKTFTPTKTGYTFVGWREDSIASSSVLSTKVMGDQPISLYAVFRREVTLCTYNASTSVSYNTQYSYYNNGNIVNPTFTLTESGLSGWSAIGWTTSATSYSATIANGGSITLSGNATYYSLYAQTITITYYNGSTSANYTSGTRYANFHSALTIANPSFALTQTSISNWSARGWSLSAEGNAGITWNNGQQYELDHSITLYGCYYRTVTVYYSANGGSGSMSNSTGTGYYNSSGNFTNASITLSANGFSAPNSDKYFNGWNVGSVYYGVSDTTVYAQWGTYSASPFDLYSLDGTYYPTNNWSTVIYYSGGSADGSSTPHYVYYVDQYGSKDCLQFFQSSNTIAPGTGAYMGYQFSRTIDRKHCQTLSTTFIQAVSEGATYLGNVVIRINGNIVWQKSNGSSVSIPLSSYGQTITLTVEFPNDLDPYSYNSRWAMFTHFNFS